MKPKLFFLILIIVSLLIGLTLNLLYNHLVISLSQQDLKVYRKTFHLGGNNRLMAYFDLFYDSYLLKIKHATQENRAQQVLFNGVKLASNLFLSDVKKRNKEIRYIYLPKAIVKEGKNFLEIIFPQNHPLEVDVLLTNYYSKIKSIDFLFPNSIYVLFPDSVFLSGYKITLKSVILSSSIVFLLFILMMIYLRKISSLGTYRLLLNQLYSLIPFLAICLLLLAISYNINKLYKVRIAPEFFLGLSFIIFFITNICMTPKNK